MKKIKSKAVFLLMICLGFSCTREEDPALPAARFPTTADIFTDVPVSLTDEFFVSFDPAEGANPNGFGVDENESFEGDVSIRLDVPSADNPDGGFIGGVFIDRGNGRDLTDYNALTFYAKATFAVPLGTVGFGSDFGENRFAASIDNLPLSSGWQQYTIPIPDPSKLTQEKGMFLFSAGTQATQGIGYTIWLDEIRFENLTTVAQPLAQIFNGVDETTTSFNSVTIPVTGLTATYNVDGTDVAVNAAPAYFNFESSDPSVASVDADGNILVNQAGTAVITATLGEGDNRINAEGSLTINSTGPFAGAPTPPARDPGDVVSIFSDAYTNVQVDNYNGFFTYATTQGGAINIAGDNIISYTQLNFVSINMFQSPDVDASAMTHIHLDINVREAVQGSDFLRLQIINNDGPGASSGTVNLETINPLLEEDWVSYDIPLSSFAGLSSSDDIDLIFFISDGTIGSIYVDNVYFYRE